MYKWSAFELSPFFCDIDSFVIYGNEGIGTVMVLEEHPLFQFVIKMVMPVFDKQFNPCSVI